MNNSTKNGTLSSARRQGPEQQGPITQTDSKSYIEERENLTDCLKAKLLQSIDDEAYVERIVRLVTAVAQYNNKMLSKLLEKQHLVGVDAKTYRLQHADSIGLRLTPYPSGCVITGHETDAEKLKDIKPIPAVLAGPNGRHFNYFQTVEPCDNPHIHTSLLKRYLACLIQMYDLYAASLTGQEWLNNKGKGGAVITGAFITKHIKDCLETICKSGLPVLAVTQRYSEGLHIGDEYSYVCKDGRVIGTSRGADAEFWVDESDPWEDQQMFMNYRITTLVRFGPQRIVFMREGADLPLIPYDTIRETTHPAQYAKILPVPRPNFRLGLYDETVTKDDDDDDESPDYLEPLEHICPIPDQPVLHRFAKSPFDFKEEFWTVVATMCVVMASIVGPTPFLIFTGLPSIVYYLRNWFKNPEPEMNIVLRNYRVKFYGKEAKLFRSFYKHNKIDGETMLPYGWYYIDDYNIVQLPQHHPKANYTNVHKLVIACCESRCWSTKAQFAKYYDATRSMYPRIQFHDDFSFMDKRTSQLKKIMASHEYKVDVPDLDHLDIKLANDESLRQALCTNITHAVVAASASNRVLRAGVVSTKTHAEHLELYTRFWKAFGGPKIELLDPMPDFSRYTGRKYRAYENAYQRFGAASDKPAYDTFLKNEANPIKFIDSKGVRFISQNTKLVNLKYKNWFHEFEEHLLSFTYAGLPIFAKGASYETRWNTINEYARRYDYAISIDFKNFDGHHITTAYEAEISFYESIGLDHQAAVEFKEAMTRGAVEYYQMQRHSGDLFTGSGNCLTVASLLEPFRERGLAYYCDGDDTLLFTNTPHVYQLLVEQLRMYGYELGDAETIELSHDEDKDFVIPFCQVYYSKDSYTIDKERSLNKMLNISAANTDAAARVALGKLQSCYYLEHLGIHFSVDVNALLAGVEVQDYVYYKMSMIDCLEHYNEAEEYDADLTDPSFGLVAEIVCELRANKRLKLLRATRAPARIYSRAVLKSIRNTMTNAYNRSGSMKPQTQDEFDHAEVIVQNAGAAIYPLLQEQLSTFKKVQQPTPVHVALPKVSAIKRPFVDSLHEDLIDVNSPELNETISCSSDSDIEPPPVLPKSPSTARNRASDRPNSVSTGRTLRL